VRPEDERFIAVADTRPDDVPWPVLAWPLAPEIRLTGCAVELRPLDPERDAVELFPALDHEVVWRHQGTRPASPDELAVDLADRWRKGMFVWLVRLVRPLDGLPAGAVVGSTSYLDVCVPDARLEIGATAYTPAAWASAVNPDTKLLLLGHAFEALRAGRVQLKTDVRNVRSQEAIARLGARYEGTLRRHKRRADGTMRDSAYFSIIAEEWPAVRERLLRRLGPSTVDL
jgi:RimJ/RimL family protein N-acetyltransferase